MIRINSKSTAVTDVSLCFSQDLPDVVIRINAARIEASSLFCLKTKKLLRIAGLAAPKNIILIVLFLLTTLGGSLHAQSLFGPNYNSILRKGNLDYKNGKYDNALLKYNQVFKNKLKDPLVNYNLGTILYKKGNFDTAAYFFDNAIKYSKNPKLKSKACYNMGNSYMQQQKYDKATQSYSNALKYNPADEDARYNLSYALRKLKKQQQQNKPKEQPQKNPETEKKEKKMNQQKAQELIKSLNNKEQDQNKKIRGQGGNTKAKDW